MKCGKVLNFEKIITPDGKAYHIKCFDGKKADAYKHLQICGWDK